MAKGLSCHRVAEVNFDTWPFKHAYRIMQGYRGVCIGCCIDDKASGWFGAGLKCAVLNGCDHLALMIGMKPAHR